MQYIQLLIFLLVFIGCNSENNKKVYKTFDKIEVSELKNTVESASAFEGGNGFEEIAEIYGWKTNHNVLSNGNPNAIKGDSITIIGGSVFPPTLRGFGKETRSQLLSLIEQATYESLLIYNPETDKYEPERATHWKLGTDSMTFFFRIDPRAHFSDRYRRGTPSPCRGRRCPTDRYRELWRPAHFLAGRPNALPE